MSNAVSLRRGADASRSGGRVGPLHLRVTDTGRASWTPAPFRTPARRKADSPRPAQRGWPRHRAPDRRAAGGTAHAEHRRGPGSTFTDHPAHARSADAAEWSGGGKPEPDWRSRGACPEPERAVLDGVRARVEDDDSRESLIRVLLVRREGERAATAREAIGSLRSRSRRPGERHRWRARTATTIRMCGSPGRLGPKRPRRRHRLWRRGRPPQGPAAVPGARGPGGSRGVRARVADGRLDRRGAPRRRNRS